jgi:hypothetical protein
MLCSEVARAWEAGRYEAKVADGSVFYGPAQDHVFQATKWVVTVPCATWRGLAGWHEAARLVSGRCLCRQLRQTCQHGTAHLYKVLWWPCRPRPVYKASRLQYFLCMITGFLLI